MQKLQDAEREEAPRYSIRIRKIKAHGLPETVDSGMASLTGDRQDPLVMFTIKDMMTSTSAVMNGGKKVDFRGEILDFKSIHEDHMASLELKVAVKSWRPCRCGAGIHVGCMGSKIKIKVQSITGTAL